jgi:Acyl-CoA synthetases (AMP-forming)/AMP-acid ligases II
VLRRGKLLSEDEIADFCRTRLAAYKRPRRLRFVKAEEVPLTATGKVHRQRLVELFR